MSPLGLHADGDRSWDVGQIFKKKFIFTEKMTNLK